MNKVPLFASLLAGVAYTSVSLHAQIATVSDFQKISQTHSDFPGVLENGGRFGASCMAGDLNGDGYDDLFVGAPSSNAVYQVNMNGEHQVAGVNLLAEIPGFTSISIEENDRWGADVAAPGDIDGNGATDLIVSAPGTNAQKGGVALIFRNTDGTILDATWIDDTAPGFDYTLNEDDGFGDCISAVPWPENNGLAVAVSARGDDDAADDAGACYLILFNANATIENTVKITGGQSGVGDILAGEDHFGNCSLVPDMNANGLPELAVGAIGDDQAGSDFGAAYLLYLNSEATVDSTHKITRNQNGFDGFINTGDGFGTDLAGPGDLDQDGHNDLVVAAPGDDDGGLDVGGLWVLLMNEDGTVRTQKAINRLEGEFEGDINFGDEFGNRVNAAGDLNGDGIPDLLAGAPADDDGGENKGAVYQLFMEYCPSPNATYTYEQTANELVFTLGGDGDSEYLWNFDDGNFSFEQNPTHVYESSGSYNICVEVTNDCGSNQFCLFISVSLGAVAAQEKPSIALYPNPAGRGWVRITGVQSRTPYRIMDVRGGELSRGWLVGDDNIAVRDLEPGVYIMHIMRGQGAHPFSLKLAVE